MNRHKFAREVYAVIRLPIMTVCVSSTKAVSAVSTLKIWSKVKTFSIKRLLVTATLSQETYKYSI